MTDVSANETHRTYYDTKYRYYKQLDIILVSRRSKYYDERLGGYIEQETVGLTIMRKVHQQSVAGQIPVGPQGPLQPLCIVRVF